MLQQSADRKFGSIIAIHSSCTPNSLHDTMDPAGNYVLSGFRDGQTTSSTISPPKGIEL